MAGWNEGVRAALLDRAGQRYEQVAVRHDLGANPGQGADTAAFEAANVDPQRRGETLSVAEFVALADAAGAVI